MREEATPAASSARAARALPASAPAPASRLQGRTGGREATIGTLQPVAPCLAALAGWPATAERASGGGAGGHAGARRRRRRRHQPLPCTHPASRPLREAGSSCCCSCVWAGRGWPVCGFVGVGRAGWANARRPAAPHLLRPHHRLDAPPRAQTGACKERERRRSATLATAHHSGPPIPPARRTSERLGRGQAAGGQGLHSCARPRCCSTATVGRPGPGRVGCADSQWTRLRKR